MAGGTGTRLYPRSRNSQPKQFQKVIGDETLLLQTVKRILPVTQQENIFISTNQRYTKQVKLELPTLGDEQLILEPAKRNTAPAMALSAALIAKHDPDAIVLSTWSDHLVLKPEIFADVVKTGFELIEKDPKQIVAVGVMPTSPHTGYGYIERQKLIKQSNGFDIYQVKRFVEKPNKETAQEYLAKGSFYWNPGYFIWQVGYFLDQIKKFMPEVYKGVMAIKDGAKASEIFHNFPDIPIDTAVMEKTEKMTVIPADLGWSDVGSWDAIDEVIEQSKRSSEGNYSEGLFVGIDTHSSTILGDEKKLIATIGLDNVIVVNSDDAILITTKGRSEEVKKIIEELKARKLDDLL